jgi:hypothetical protein
MLNFSERQGFMAGAVSLEDLVISEVGSALYLDQAPGDIVVKMDGSRTKLTTTEMCHKRPSIITVFARLHHLLEPRDHLAAPLAPRPTPSHTQPDHRDYQRIAPEVEWHILDSPEPTKELHARKQSTLTDIAFR